MNNNLYEEVDTVTVVTDSLGDIVAVLENEGDLEQWLESQKEEYPELMGEATIDDFSTEEVPIYTDGYFTPSLVEIGAQVMAHVESND